MAAATATGFLQLAVAVDTDTHQAVALGHLHRRLVGTPDLDCLLP
jgi:hypothetical protein